MSQSFNKSRKKSKLRDRTNGKCGEISFCLQVGKRFYALNCLFCPQICIQWDAFINHMEEEHEEELRSDHLLQQEIEEVDVDANNIKGTVPKQSSGHLLEELMQSSRTEVNDSVSDELFVDYDDPLMGDEADKCLNQSFDNREVNVGKPYQTVNIADEQSKMTDVAKRFNRETSNNIDKYSNNQITDILDLLRKIQEGQKNMEKELTSKFDQFAVDVNSIRSVVFSMKAKVYGTIDLEQHIAPIEPFKSIEQYRTFEKQLENEETYTKFVNELYSAHDKAYDKFVRNSWRKIFSDELAEQFSWRGTTTKMCIRSLHVTMAIRTAFRQKFALEDCEFDKVTQKHFNYAHDRVLKTSKNQARKANS